MEVLEVWKEMIPSVEMCLELMGKYDMLDNIKVHSIMVEKVARLIAEGLVKAGVVISLEKVSAGALMHDIAKTPCLHTREDHAAKGKEICLQNDLGEIAEIVGQHIRLRNYKPKNDIDEEEIVYYADKRVNHDRIVTLAERLEDLLIRYGRNREPICQYIRENFDVCKKVEERLFARLDFGPEEIADRIKGK